MSGRSVFCHQAVTLNPRYAPHRNFIATFFRELSSKKVGNLDEEAHQIQNQKSGSQSQSPLLRSASELHRHFLRGAIKQKSWEFGQRNTPNTKPKIRQSFSIAVMLCIGPFLVTMCDKYKSLRHFLFDHSHKPCHNQYSHLFHRAYDHDEDSHHYDNSKLENDDIEL